MLALVPDILRSVSSFLSASLKAVVLFLRHPGHAEGLGVGLSYVWKDKGKRLQFKSLLKSGTVTMALTVCGRVTWPMTVALALATQNLSVAN